MVTGYGVNLFSEVFRLSPPTAESIVFDIAIILIVSAILAFIAKVLRQPLIPAYVVTGLLIGPLVLGFVKNIELIYSLSEIGIAFLLFTAGLEISLKKIKEANLKKILFVGVIQVCLVFAIGLTTVSLFNLTLLQASYIGIVLAFGSTMVVIKLLADKGELVTLHGRLILGILLLQDLFAIIAIILFMSGGFAITPILAAFIKLILIVGIALFLQKFVLNSLFRFAARSTELLFLASLAVLFLFIILTYLTDLSIVIGAFLAGVILANSDFKPELESRISPLRDFFSILFFVALGMQIVFVGLAERLGLFLFLIAVAMLIKPILTILLLRITGYHPKTSFLTGFSLAQLSEFSLIIGMIGLSMGVLDISIFSTIVLATITTMALTPYLIKFKNSAYVLLRKPMNAFKFFPVKENLEYVNKNKKTILLVGAHRMGSVLLKRLEKIKDKLLVIDYNPEIINALMKKKISCIYGDLGSPELLENRDMNNFKLIISTIPDHDDNIKLLRKIKARIDVQRKTKVILTSSRISEAIDLYERGADYVVLPKVLSGEKLIDLLGDKKSDLKRLRKMHLRQLKRIHRVLY